MAHHILHAFLHEAHLPPLDGGLVDFGRLHDLHRVQPVLRPEHYGGAAN